MEDSKDMDIDYLIKSKKGLAVLIINSAFQNPEDFRPGAKKDEENMIELFETNLKFKTVSMMDYTKAQLLKRLREGWYSCKCIYFIDKLKTCRNDMYLHVYK